MLDQLRAMGVFACVVEKNSFSGAARELGITTSAVSQQIRSLEQEMEVILLHRSTRKLSLTEVGQAFFHSCKEMLSAAERGKIRINELRDDLVGELRIVATPELCAHHVIPALSHWMAAHRGLFVHLATDEVNADKAEGRIDIALRVADQIDDTYLHAIELSGIEQILVAAPSYINQSTLLTHPDDLKQHDLICVQEAKQPKLLSLQQAKTKDVVQIEARSRLSTNNTLVAQTLCLQGHGIAQLSYLDAQKYLITGHLVEVLPEWNIPSMKLFAVINKYDQQSTKILRCIEVLKQYFLQMPSTHAVSEAS